MSKKIRDSAASMTEGITELHRQQALLKTGALQNAIFNSANFSSIATDAKGVIQIFNVGAERMLGYTAADVMNKITPADISDPQEVIARAKVLSLELATTIAPGFEALVFKASRGIEDIYELTYIRRDGSRFPAVVSVTALRDDQNAIIGYLLIGTDNTARKQAEEARQAAEARLGGVIASALDAIIAIDANHRITLFNAAAEHMFGLTSDQVLGSRLDRLIPARFHATHGDQIRGFGATRVSKRVMSKPSEVFGLHVDGHEFPIDASISQLEVNGETMFTVMLRDITEKKKAEAALRKAGALQNAIFNSANFSSIATDAKGVIQIFNVGAECMLGYTAADVMNKITPADISDPQEVIERAKVLSLELATTIAPGFEALVFKASRGIEDIYELTYIRKDGSRFPAIVSVTALRDDQNVIIGYLLIGTDNTARKQIDDKLRTASQYARSLIEASLDPLVTISPEGKITDVNAGSVKVTGVPREKLIGTDFSDYFTEPDKAREGYQQVFAKGFVTDYPLTIRHEDGRLTNVLYNASVYKDVQGNVLGVFAAARDITARKQAEAALRKAGALQNAIFNSANFSSIATDAKGVIQIFNVGAECMLGYTAADVMNKITPADISDPQEVIARAEALSLELGTPIAPGFEALVFKASRGIEDIYELTYIRKDGSRFPAVVSVTALRDDQNAIIGYLLIGTNNTARKQVEAEQQHLLATQEETNKQLQEANATLQASEEKLAVTLHSIGDAVIATDAEGRVTLVNPLTELLTGWTREEAIGRSVEEIFHIINKGTRQPAIIPVTETLALGTIQGLAKHTVLIARDGSEADIADSCAPIRNRDGQVVGAVLVFRNVTEEYKVQQALRDSTAQIQTILNTVVDGIITIHAHGGIIETVNPAAERMFGYSVAELIGQKFSLLIPELDRDEHNGNGSLEYYSASDEARAIGLGREVMGRRKDGSMFPMEMAVSEMWLGGQRFFTGILRDITARKQAEEALLKAGALQVAIFNSANFSSIATDAKGVIQIFNVGAERLLGYTAADVMNKITPADISDPQEVIARAEVLSLELGTPIAPGFDALAYKASRGIEDIYELTYIRKDGSRFPAVVSVTALRNIQGAIIGYLLIGTDNTARLRVEAERTLLYETLQDKNIELENTKVVVEKASRAKSDFLSSMSHELRTPLNAILGFAQLLEAGSPLPTASQVVRLHQIIKAGWYLLELINEILDLAVIESGKLSLSREPVSLIDIMHECQAMIEPQAQKHGIQINYHPFDYTWFANADRTRVKQVLINLLSNAIKYNRAQGTVEVVSTACTPERIRISIKDSGAGLPAEKLAQLFQPFNRLGQEGGNEEGTGIGLVVCKQLVELMGGSIGVESTVGVGSEFWIELLRDTTPQHTAREVMPAVRVPHAQGNAEQRTLLYVEDNPANLLLVEQIIESHSHLRMLSARDGNLGIALARAHLPNVILMDINLPGISGFEVLEILRKDPTTARIPVLAISANAMPRDIMKGLEAGFFRYLTKPIKVNEFMEALGMALEFAETGADGAVLPGSV